MLSSTASGKIYSGTCPNKTCNGVVIFSDYSKNAHCYSCKADHPISLLVNAFQLTDSCEALVAFLLAGTAQVKQDPPVVSNSLKILLHLSSLRISDGNFCFYCISQFPFLFFFFPFKKVLL